MGQNKSLDSLNYILQTTKNDTTKLRCEKMLAEMLEVYRISKWDSLSKKAIILNQHDITADCYNNLGFLYQNEGVLDSSINHFDLAINLNNKIKRFKDAAFSMYNKAYCYKKFNVYNNAIIQYNLCLKLCESIEYKNVESYCYNDLSIVYGILGNTSLSIEMILKAIKIQSKLNDFQGLGASYSNLASIYYYQKDYTKAEEIYRECLNVYQKANYNQGIALIYANIGTINFYKKNSKIAIEYLLRSNELREKLNDLAGVSDNFNTLGKHYASIDSLQKAEVYLQKALTIKEDIEDKKGLVATLNAIAEIKITTNNLEMAIKYCQRAKTIAEEINYLKGIKESSFILYEANKKFGNYNEAIKNYEQFISTRDSLQNKELQKSSLQSLLKYEYEKKAAADSVRVAEEKKLTTIKIQQEKTQRNYLYWGLALVGLFALFMANRFTVANKQKKLIEEQKQIVEHQKAIVDEKQKEILDSIRYAKRIQQSLLPSNYSLKKHLNK